MNLIVLLLIVVALAVGVRVLESGSRIGLTLAALVVVVLGARLISREPTMAQMSTLAAVVADEGEADSSQLPSTAGESVEGSEADPSSEVSAALTDDRPEPSNNNAETPESGTAADSETAPGDSPSVGGDVEIGLVATPGKPIVPPRPEWVEADPVEEGDSRIVVVSSGPQGHLGECQSALDAELEQAVDAYIDEYLGQVYGDKLQASTLVSFPAEYIRDNLVPDGQLYDEKIQFSFGPMYQSHAQVAFTPAFRAVLDSERVNLDKQWKQIVVAGRLTGAAIIFGSILALLAVVSGYFRLDTATRGFYTARLQFLATVAILAVIVAGVLLARNVDWM
jgi:hypothetical protein